MTPHLRIYLCALAVLFGSAVSTAQADSLPDDRTISYFVRENPSDPQSSVVFTIEMQISAQEEDDGFVGWEIESVRLIDNDNPISSQSEWIEYLPEVHTQDGLWWVEHDDPDSPKESEFDEPPLLSGTADAEGTQADMDYSFEGAPYVGGPQLYNGSVTSLTYAFTLVGEADPEEEGEDEPTEIDED